VSQHGISLKEFIKINLTAELESLVKKKVRSGRYTDESDVMRDALRALEMRDDYESPALETAILEGVRGPHRPYGKATLDRIRRRAEYDTGSGFANASVAANKLGRDKTPRQT
jgi:antitoxin ParD1/3/4